MARPRKIPLHDFQTAIQDALKTYSDEVIEDTKKVIDDVSKKALKQVKTNAPIGERKKYKSSLKNRKYYETLTQKTNVIYGGNGEHRLTHLLEHGHAKVNGGRTNPIPHFEAGEDYVKENFMKELKKKIGG